MKNVFKKSNYTIYKSHYSFAKTFSTLLNKQKVFNNCQALYEDWWCVLPRLQDGVTSVYFGEIENFLLKVL